MFVKTDQIRQHFRYDPFKAMIAPRPIGWISTVSASGQHNLAPYSFSNAVCGLPPMLMFVSHGEKDSLTNCQASGQFCFNLVSQAQMQQMSRSSAATDADEFQLAGVESEPCQLIHCQRVAKAPASMECQVTSIQRLQDMHQADTDCWMVIGQVVGMHVRPDLITSDGLFDTAGADLVARCGYKDYWVDGQLIELARG